jgi:hypothetical protein
MTNPSSDTPREATPYEKAKYAFSIGASLTDESMRLLAQGHDDPPRKADALVEDMDEAPLPVSHRLAAIADAYYKFWDGSEPLIASSEFRTATTNAIKYAEQRGYAAGRVFEHTRPDTSCMYEHNHPTSCRGLAQAHALLAEIVEDQQAGRDAE